MTERRKILDLFEEQRELVNSRVREGIEKHRKGDAGIKLVDQSGAPVTDATIKLVQKNHEFRFGANIFMLDEMESDEKNEKYKQYFADVFNMATLPFYWDAVEPERGQTRYTKNSPKRYRRPSIDLCLEFCQKHGIEPREHGLAYAQFFPKWLYDADVDEIKKALVKRYEEISGRYADKIRTIEVTNEMDTGGKTSFWRAPDFVEWCFKLAEQYFPNNQLVINDHTPLAWEDKGLFTDKYYAYTEAAMLKGARIDAIGMQYHLFNKPRETEYEKTRLTLNPENLYRHLDIYAHFGKPLQITEVTVPAYSWDEEDEKIQAEIIENLYSIWFSHPNVEQIIYWNLVDGYAHPGSKIPEEKAREMRGNMSTGENYYHGGLLRFDLSPKPAYLKIKELLQERWHTEVEIVTDEAGHAEFRGFYGAYCADITVGGQTISKMISLKKNAANRFVITL